MRVHVLGTGTALPQVDRGPAGALIEHDGRRILVDCGSGTLQRICRAGADPRELDAVIVTHRHPDHCADLVPLVFAMHSGIARQRDLPVIGGSGLNELWNGLRSVWGKWVELGEGASVVVDEVPLDRPAQRLVAGMIVRTEPAPHSGGAVHVRIEAGGAVVVISGDCGRSENLFELAKGADLLVIECSAPDERPIPRHMTPSLVREVAERARPREIWLTHFYDGVVEADALRIVAESGVMVRRAADLDIWPG